MFVKLAGVAIIRDIKIMVSFLFQLWNADLAKLELHS
jgi:hypothetical protein